MILFEGSLGRDHGSPHGGLELRVRDIRGLAFDQRALEVGGSKVGAGDGGLGRLGEDRRLGGGNAMEAPHEAGDAIDEVLLEGADGLQVVADGVAER
jgi:hypothetical protein